MSDLDVVLDANQAAVRDFIAAAERCEAVWRTPRAPGKWSPSQLSEHVAMALDESANEVAGLPCKFPRFPAFVRPLVRAVFFNRVVRKEHFPRARTSRAFDPITGPASPGQARTRLEAAAARLEQACRERAASGQPVQSGLFGAVSVTDYAKFQALHTRHHSKQFPAV